MINCKTATLALALSILTTVPAISRAVECEGTPSATKLSIVVDGVQSNKGLMTASLYPNDKSQFLQRNGALKVWRIPAQSPLTQMCIWLKAPGTYAVAVYHDANSNQKLDIGMLGPTEDYGFSRNPHIFFSKPSLGSVRFAVPAGETTVHIRLNHT